MAAQAVQADPKKDFNNTLVSMMDALDDVMEKYQFMDGEYKHMAEGFLKLRNLYDHIIENEVYITVARSVRRPRAERRAPPSLDEKMTSPNYEWCEYCNTPIKIDKKNYFKKLHLQTAKCSQITQTKKTTIKKPIFKNVAFDIPLQVLNRCVWRKMKMEYKKPEQRASIMYYINGEGSNVSDWWEKYDEGKWDYSADF